MRRIAAGQLALALVVLGPVSTPAQGLATFPDPDSTAKVPSAPTSVVNPTAGVTQALRDAEAVSKDLGQALDRSAQPPPTLPVPSLPEPPPVTAESPDSAAARDEVKRRLKSLEGEKSPDGPSLVELLNQRLKLIAAWEKQAEAHRAVESPSVSPEREAETLKAELAATRARLDESTRDPDRLLPAAFRAAASSGPSESILKAMKEQIDAVEDKAHDHKAELDGAATDANHKKADPLAALRADREAERKAQAKLASARGLDEAELAAAKSPEARVLTRDRVVNDDWQCRILGERLRTIEANIALETRRESLTELRRQVQQANWDLSSRCLVRMQARYRSAADRQQRKLAQQAADEQARAAHANDPLERFRARRAAELLDLESRLLNEEKTLAAKPSVSLEEQEMLANRAEEDLAHLKKLIEGGRSGTLVALRLNNSYRRTDTDRERITRVELARATGLVEVCENALTDLELDGLDGYRDEKVALGALLEDLPPERRTAAIALDSDFEAKRLGLLSDRRVALRKLVDRAEEAEQQVRRRLRILDAQHAFIRTHIFWVRDAEPLGPETLSLARHEAQRIARAALLVAREPGHRSLWGRASWEFSLACVGLLALPWPLEWLRRTLSRKPALPA